MLSLSWHGFSTIMLVLAQISLIKQPNAEYATGVEGKENYT